MLVYFRELQCNRFGYIHENLFFVVIHFLHHSKPLHKKYWQFLTNLLEEIFKAVAYKRYFTSNTSSWRVTCTCTSQDREVDRSALYDHSMRPAIITPETKKADLYKSPAVFEHLDKRAIDVSLHLFTLKTVLSY